MCKEGKQYNITVNVSASWEDSKGVTQEELDNVSKEVAERVVREVALKIGMAYQKGSEGADDRGFNNSKEFLEDLAEQVATRITKELEKECREKGLLIQTKVVEE